jgi:hypothetical protein
MLHSLNVATQRAKYHTTRRQLCHAARIVSSFFRIYNKKAIGGSLTTAAYPLTETGFVNNICEA